ETGKADVPDAASQETSRRCRSPLAGVGRRSGSFRERREHAEDGLTIAGTQAGPSRSLEWPAAPMTVGLAAFALALAAISFCIGPSGLGAGALLEGLFSGQGPAGIIAREIRLPRAMLALFVGAALGISGAALQGLFRNPLAEPGVTGVTSSAGLGAIVAQYFGFASAHPILLPAFAIFGALASAFVLYLLSRAGAGPVALVLGGVAIASLAT